MTKITLVDLISKAEQELLRLNYSKVSMTYYMRIFKKIADFSALQGENHFNESVAMAWLDNECDFSNKEKRKELSEYDVYRLRAVKTLASVANGEKIPVQYVRKIPEFTDETLMKILNRLSEFSKSKGFAKSTQYLHRTTATVLFKFLLERNISASDVNPQIISEFIRTYDGYTKKTMESKMYALRIITKFLYDEQIVPQDCSPLLPKVCAPKATTLPSVWKREDIIKLFAAIDRSNPLGKRDCAILLLALRLGIRGCDIKRLKIENFDFVLKKEVTFAQSKTGGVVVLPILPDVGWAVIDYLKNGRPRNCDSPFIFVKHTAPYNVLTEDNHLYGVIVKYARRAGISLRGDRKYGIHSLRHTLATSLLEGNTKLDDISNILGHEDEDATTIYLKKNTEFLRECALDGDFVEVPNV